MKLILNKEFKSIKPFSSDLPKFAVLTGVNGAGKTQILKSISHNKLKILDDDGKSLYPVKYVSSHSLSPNQSTVLNQFKSTLDVKELWQNIEYFKKDIRENPNFSIETAFSQVNRPGLDTINQILRNTKKRLEDLSYDDFILYFPLEDENVKTDVFEQNFTNLFKSYHDKLNDNKYRKFRNEELKETNITFLTDKEFDKIFGEPPWDIVNNIIKIANLGFHIKSPNHTHKEAPFALKLIDNISLVEINITELSSGEKVLMALVLAIYNSNFDREFPKVLLLDEPDASLHPSMSKTFLDVLQKVFVKEKKVNVIITTHSPSTVALAPEESIFVVNRKGVIIEKTNKDKALKILTAGVPSFSVNYENRRQVFVESPYDVSYYERFYRYLSRHLEPEISLTFISSGDSRRNLNGSNVATCEQVKKITNLLREGGNKFIYGIIDRDLNNKSTESIKVLGNGNRYNIENYILDPLLIGALLLRQKVVTKSEFSMKEDESFIDLKNFEKDRLQPIADYVTRKVAKIANQTNTNVVSCKLINGIEINIPKWYLDHHGHKLEDDILKTFKPLNILKKKEDSLKIEILDKIVDDVRGIMSMDILDLFRELQSS